MINSPNLVGVILGIAASSLGFSQIVGQQPPAPNIIQVRGFEENAGSVNFVKGEVAVKGAKGNRQRARLLQLLADGDVVETGPVSRAEILLIPGCFLRLDENTRCVMADLKINNQKIELLSGRAIVEILVWEPLYYEVAYGYEPVRVVTPHTVCVLLSGGAFDFKIASDRTSIDTVKGIAQVGGKQVRAGEQALALRDTPVTVTKRKYLDDEFARWMTERAGLLTKANASLKHERWYKELANGDVSVTAEPRVAKQPAEFYVVSASGGGSVSFAEQGAQIKRGDADWATLIAPTSLEYGDRVRTAAGAHTELILNWGALARLGGKTEIVYSRAQNGQVQLSVTSGSVIVDSYARTKDQVFVSTQAADFTVLPRGNLRLNCEGIRTEIMLRSGSIKLSGKVIAAGKRIVLSPDSRKVESLDKAGFDELDLWSWRRASSRTSMIPPPSLMGLWYYMSGIGSYTFVGGNWNFRSPYGGRYPVKLLPVIGFPWSVRPSAPMSRPKE